MSIGDTQEVGCQILPTQYEDTLRLVLVAPSKKKGNAESFVIVRQQQVNDLLIFLCAQNKYINAK